MVDAPICRYSIGCILIAHPQAHKGREIDENYDYTKWESKWALCAAA